MQMWNIHHNQWCRSVEVIDATYTTSSISSTSTTTDFTAEFERKVELKTYMAHMCCYIAYIHAKDISDHSENSFSMLIDLQNLGVET